VRRSALGARLPLLIAAVALVVFAVLALSARNGGSFGWDRPVVDFISDVAPIADEDVHIDPYIDAITIAAGALALVVILLALARRRLRAAVFAVAAVAGASLLSAVVKEVVDRQAIERTDGSGFSFPSGTAAWSMALVAAVVLLAPHSRRLVIGLTGAAVLVTLGAVIAWEEWHYPSDVLAGWCLALAWAIGIWLALGRPALAR
jgi:membrane-associated phospholipid phosphatase